MPGKTPLTPYQRRLFVLLSVATLFEGYDFIALAQILPNLRADFGLSKSAAGLLFGFVNMGTIVAWLLVRRADRWGRRRVLMITIVGYTLFTFLSGLSTGVYMFALCQFAARIFLIGEWAISNVYAAEEFPAERRGMVIGVLQAFSSLGSIVCAGAAPLLLATHFGWRSVYFVGIVPLLLMIWARRNLRETTRFSQQQAEGNIPEQRPLLGLLKGPYRRRVFELGAIWFLTYACSNTAISFWKEFAVGERGMSDGDVGLAITIAALGSMPLVFLSGKLLDVIGRRKGAIVIFLSTAVATVAAYGLHGKWPLIAALTLAIFGVSAVLPVLNAYTAELFPTELRGDAFAWINNIIGRIGYVLAPIVVGVAAESYGWGAAIRPTAIGPLAALVLILLLLPETKGRELEDTAALQTKA